MDFKKQIFWLVLGGAVLVVLGLYFFTVPGIGSDAEKLKEECKSKAEFFSTMAKKSDQSDQIKTDEHVRQSTEFGRTLDAQREALLQVLSTKKLDQKFDKAVPVGTLEFDGWLNELRTKLSTQASDAKLQLPAAFDKMMFKKEETSENSPDITRHRDYRLKQMVIVDETINILCRKPGKQKVTELQLKSDQPEITNTVDAGAVALERLSIITGKELAERNKLWQDEAWARAERKNPGKPVGGQLPIDATTAVDIQFIAPLSAVPGIVQALETSTRYAAVVSRIDFQRAAASPFPSALDMAPAPVAETGTGTPATPAAAVPTAAKQYINTHFQEAPVRVQVSLDLYEYDAAKAKTFSAAFPPAH